MKKITIILAATASLAGCAGPSVTPPSAPDADHSSTYQADFDTVWESTVDWFAINNIPIKNIEKASGIIGSEYALGSNYSQVDCGTVDPGGMHILRDTNVVANINVLVRDVGAGTSVQPNVFGHGTAMLQDAWNGFPVSMKLESCISTGELEKSLHQYLNSNI